MLTYPSVAGFRQILLAFEFKGSIIPAAATWGATMTALALLYYWLLQGCPNWIRVSVLFFLKDDAPLLGSSRFFQEKNFPPKIIVCKQPNGIREYFTLHPFVTIPPYQKKTLMKYNNTITHEHQLKIGRWRRQLNIINENGNEKNENGDDHILESNDEEREEYMTPEEIMIDSNLIKKFDIFSESLHGAEKEHVGMGRYGWRLGETLKFLNYVDDWKHHLRILEEEKAKEDGKRLHSPSMLRRLLKTSNNITTIADIPADYRVSNDTPNDYMLIFFNAGKCVFSERSPQALQLLGTILGLMLAFKVSNCMGRYEEAGADQIAANTYFLMSFKAIVNMANIGILFHADSPTLIRKLDFLKETVAHWFSLLSATHVNRTKYGVRHAETPQIVSRLLHNVFVLKYPSELQVYSDNSREGDRREVNTHLTVLTNVPRNTSEDMVGKNKKTSWWKNEDSSAANLRRKKQILKAEGVTEGDGTHRIRTLGRSEQYIIRQFGEVHAFEDFYSSVCRLPAREPCRESGYRETLFGDPTKEGKHKTEENEAEENDGKHKAEENFLTEVHIGKSAFEKNSKEKIFDLMRMNLEKIFDQSQKNQNSDQNNDKKNDQNFNSSKEGEHRGPKNVDHVRNRNSVNDVRYSKNSNPKTAATMMSVGVANPIKPEQQYAVQRKIYDIIKANLERFQSNRGSSPSYRPRNIEQNPTQFFRRDPIFTPLIQGRHAATKPSSDGDSKGSKETISDSISDSKGSKETISDTSVVNDGTVAADESSVAEEFDYLSGVPEIVELQSIKENGSSKQTISDFDTFDDGGEQLHLAQYKHEITAQQDFYSQLNLMAGKDLKSDFGRPEILDGVYHGRAKPTTRPQQVCLESTVPSLPLKVEVTPLTLKEMKSDKHSCEYSENGFGPFKAELKFPKLLGKEDMEDFVTRPAIGYHYHIEDKIVAQHNQKIRNQKLQDEFGLSNLETGRTIESIADAILRARQGEKISGIADYYGPATRKTVEKEYVMQKNKGKLDTSKGLLQSILEGKSSFEDEKNGSDSVKNTATEIIIPRIPKPIQANLRIGGSQSSSSKSSIEESLSSSTIGNNRNHTHFLSIPTQRTIDDDTPNLIQVYHDYRQWHRKLRASRGDKDILLEKSKEKNRQKDAELSGKGGKENRGGADRCGEKVGGGNRCGEKGGSKEEDGIYGKNIHAQLENVDEERRIALQTRNRRVEWMKRYNDQMTANASGNYLELEIQERKVRKEKERIEAERRQEELDKKRGFEEYQRVYGFSPTGMHPNRAECNRFTNPDGKDSEDSTNPTKSKESAAESAGGSGNNTIPLEVPGDAGNNISFPCAITADLSPTALRNLANDSVLNKVFSTDRSLSDPQISDLARFNKEMVERKYDDKKRAILLGARQKILSKLAAVDQKPEKMELPVIEEVEEDEEKVDHELENVDDVDQNEEKVEHVETTKTETTKKEELMDDGQEILYLDSLIIEGEHLESRLIRESSKSSKCSSSGLRSTTVGRKRSVSSDEKETDVISNGVEMNGVEMFIGSKTSTSKSSSSSTSDASKEQKSSSKPPLKNPFSSLTSGLPILGVSSSKVQNRNKTVGSKTLSDLFDSKSESLGARKISASSGGSLSKTRNVTGGSLSKTEHEENHFATHYHVSAAEYKKQIKQRERERKRRYRDKWGRNMGSSSSSDLSDTQEFLEDDSEKLKNLDEISKTSSSPASLDYLREANENEYFSSVGSRTRLFTQPDTTLVLSSSKDTTLSSRRSLSPVMETGETPFDHENGIQKPSNPRIRRRHNAKPSSGNITLEVERAGGTDVHPIHASTQPVGSLRSVGSVRSILSGMTNMIAGGFFWNPFSNTDGKSKKTRNWKSKFGTTTRTKTIGSETIQKTGVRTAAPRNVSGNPALPRGRNAPLRSILPGYRIYCEDISEIKYAQNQPAKNSSSRHETEHEIFAANPRSASSRLLQFEGEIRELFEASQQQIRENERNEQKDSGSERGFGISSGVIRLGRMLGKMFSHRESDDEQDEASIFESGDTQYESGYDIGSPESKDPNVSFENLNPFENINPLDLKLFTKQKLEKLLEEKCRSQLLQRKQERGETIAIWKEGQHDASLRNDDSRNHNPRRGRDNATHRRDDPYRQDDSGRRGDRSRDRHSSDDNWWSSATGETGGIRGETGGIQETIDWPNDSDGERGGHQYRHDRYRRDRSRTGRDRSQDDGDRRRDGRNRSRDNRDRGDRSRDDGWDRTKDARDRDGRSRDSDYYDPSTDPHAIRWTDISEQDRRIAEEDKARKQQEFENWLAWEKQKLDWRIGDARKPGALPLRVGSSRPNITDTRGTRNSPTRGGPLMHSSTRKGSGKGMNGASATSHYREGSQDCDRDSQEGVPSEVGEKRRKGKVQWADEKSKGKKKRRSQKVAVLSTSEEDERSKKKKKEDRSQSLEKDGPRPGTGSARTGSLERPRTTSTTPPKVPRIIRSPIRANEKDSDASSQRSDSSTERSEMREFTSPSFSRSYSPERSYSPGKSPGGRHSNISNRSSLKSYEGSHKSYEGGNPAVANPRGDDNEIVNDIVIPEGAVGSQPAGGYVIPGGAVYNPMTGSYYDPNAGQYMQAGSQSDPNSGGAKTGGMLDGISSQVSVAQVPVDRVDSRKTILAPGSGSAGLSASSGVKILEADQSDIMDANHEVAVTAGMVSFFPRLASTNMSVAANLEYNAQVAHYEQCLEIHTQLHSMKEQFPHATPQELQQLYAQNRELQSYADKAFEDGSMGVSSAIGTTEEVDKRILNAIFCVEDRFQSVDRKMDSGMLVVRAGKPVKIEYEKSFSYPSTNFPTLHKMNEQILDTDVLYELRIDGTRNLNHYHDFGLDEPTQFQRALSQRCAFLREGDLGKRFKLEILGPLLQEEFNMIAEQQDQEALIQSWISMLCNKFQQEGYVPFPVTLGVMDYYVVGLNAGIDSLMAIRRLCLIPFPFPMTQVVALLFLGLICSVPVYCVSFFRSEVWPLVFAGIICWILYALNENAVVLECPMGESLNDLPLLEMHTDLLDSIQSILEINRPENEFGRFILPLLCETQIPSENNENFPKAYAELFGLYLQDSLMREMLGIPEELAEEYLNVMVYGRDFQSAKALSVMEQQILDPKHSGPEIFTEYAAAALQEAAIQQQAERESGRAGTGGSTLEGARGGGGGLSLLSAATLLHKLTARSLGQPGQEDNRQSSESGQFSTMATGLEKSMTVGPLGQQGQKMSGIHKVQSLLEDHKSVFQAKDTQFDGLVQGAMAMGRSDTIGPRHIGRKDPIASIEYGQGGTGSGPVDTGPPSQLAEAGGNAFPQGMPAHRLPEGGVYGSGAGAQAGEWDDSRLTVSLPVQSQPHDGGDKGQGMGEKGYGMSSEAYEPGMEGSGMYGYDDPYGTYGASGYGQDGDGYHTGMGHGSLARLSDLLEQPGSPDSRKTALMKGRDGEGGELGVHAGGGFDLLHSNDSAQRQISTVVSAHHKMGGMLEQSVPVGPGKTMGMPVLSSMLAPKKADGHRPSNLDVADSKGEETHPSSQQAMRVSKVGAVSDSNDGDKDKDTKESKVDALAKSGRADNDSKSDAEDGKDDREDGGKDDIMGGKDDAKEGGKIKKKFGRFDSIFSSPDKSPAGKSEKNDKSDKKIDKNDKNSKKNLLNVERQAALKSTWKKSAKVMGMLGASVTADKKSKDDEKKRKSETNKAKDAEDHDEKPPSSSKSVATLKTVIKSDGGPVLPSGEGAGRKSAGDLGGRPVLPNGGKRKGLDVFPLPTATSGEPQERPSVVGDRKSLGVGFLPMVPVSPARSERDSSSNANRDGESPRSKGSDDKINGAKGTTGDDDSPQQVEKVGSMIDRIRSKESGVGHSSTRQYASFRSNQANEGTVVNVAPNVSCVKATSPVGVMGKGIAFQSPTKKDEAAGGISGIAGIEMQGTKEKKKKNMIEGKKLKKEKKSKKDSTTKDSKKTPLDDGKSDLMKRIITVEDGMASISPSISPEGYSPNSLGGFIPNNNAAPKNDASQNNDAASNNDVAPSNNAAMNDSFLGVNGAFESLSSNALAGFDNSGLGEDHDSLQFGVTRQVAYTTPDANGEGVKEGNISNLPDLSSVGDILPNQPHELLINPQTGISSILSMQQQQPGMQPGMRGQPGAGVPPNQPRGYPPNEYSPRDPDQANMAMMMQHRQQPYGMPNETEYPQQDFAPPNPQQGGGYPSRQGRPPSVQGSAPPKPRGAPQSGAGHLGAAFELQTPQGLATEQNRQAQQALWWDKDDVDY